MYDILDHIKSSSNESSRFKGEEIYYQNRQKLQFLNFEQGKLDMKVKGTGRGIWYDVTIRVKGDGTFSSSCSCSYDWGGICKHQVAVFLYFKEYIERNAISFRGENGTGSAADKALYDQSDVVVTLPMLGEEEVLQFISKHLYQDAKAIARSRRATLLRDPSHIDAVMNTPKGDIQLRFEKNGTKLHTNCSCGEKTQDPFCVHKAGALLQLFYEDGAFAFESQRDWTEEKAALLASYGYSPNDKGIDLKFDFVFQQGNIVLVPKDASILPIQEEKLGTQFGFLHGHSKRSARPTLRQQQVAEDTMAVGYVLGFDIEDPLIPVKILPFKGKVSKDGQRFVSHQAALSSADLSFMSFIDDADRQIIAFIEDLDANNILKVMQAKGLVPVGIDRYRLITEPQYAEALSIAAQYVHSQFMRIFKMLVGKRLFVNTDGAIGRIGPMQVITIAEKPISPSFLLDEKGQDLVLHLSIQSGQELILPQTYLHISSVALLAESVLYPTRTPDDFPALKMAFDHATMRVRKAGKEAFVRRVLLPLLQRYPVEVQVADVLIQEIDGVEPEAKLFLNEQEGFLVLTPLFEYEGKQVSPFEPHDIVYEEDDDEGSILRIRRDYDYEEEMLLQLLQSHERFVQEGISLFLAPSAVLEHNWFFEVFDFLKEKGYEIYGFNLLKSFRYSPHKPETIFTITSGIDWFDCEITVKFGDQVVSLKDVRKALISGERYVKLGDGTLGILPEDWIQKYGAILKLGTLGKNGVRLSKVHFSVVDELYEEISNEEVLREIAYKKRRLREFERIEEVTVPASITASLRHYQVAGFNWLHFLHEFGWGGCLADDMGLGKTLQALTFLQSLKEKNKQLVSVVIAPTSLMFNWAKEIEKFAPELKYMVHHGTNRSEDIRNFYEYDVVLTTYGIVVRDIEKLRRIRFDYAILDESQAIKNVTSKRYKAVSLLQAKNRLALTGTPVENNTFELYAQMQFLNPGILGSQEFFKMEYANPIDKKGEASRINELKKLVYPFILRRTKEQVAKDLPDKSETVLYCEMGVKQRKVYDSFKNFYRDKILNLIEEQGIERSGMYILEGLLKLRQICDSPSLLKDKDVFTDESVKLNELSSQVQEVIGAHKVLIFSQFVEMLTLVRKQLERRGIDYCYLDGQTRNREAVVEDFQTNTSKRVFLISLKAGGVGLNLTAADYVYLIDPWWNPAVEQQAIDRTHRIGQTQKVFAYKMICKDTVEEKILQLQQRKRDLVSDIISPEQSFIKSLTKEDIEALFS